MFSNHSPENLEYLGFVTNIFCYGGILWFFWQYGWELCLDVMLVGATRGVMLAVDRMSPKNGGNGGRIVNTASMAGLSVIDETKITTFC